METTLSSISGLSQLQAELLALPARIEQNIIRGALRAGVKEIVNEAKHLVHSVSGDLEKSIRASVRPDRINGKIVARIKAGNKKAYYAHMVERGTARHWIRATVRPERLTRRGFKTVSLNTLNKQAKRGSLKIGGVYVGDEVIHPGATRKPFMRPALDSKWRESVSVFAYYVRSRLAKEVKKNAR